MLQRRVYKMENPERFLTFKSGSIMHGVIMELAGDNVKHIHSEQIKAFSQYICRENREATYWIISTLNSEAADIIFGSLEKQSSIFIKAKNEQYSLIEESRSQTSYKELLHEELVNEDLKKQISIEYISPAVYKSEGKFLAFPRVSNILINLYHKWVKFSKNADIYDNELVDRITNGTKVDSYSLKSVNFPLEGTSILGFRGYLNLYSKLPISLLAIRNALLQFGWYAGMGSKTALGMGGVKVHR